LAAARSTWKLGGRAALRSALDPPPPALSTCTCVSVNPGKSAAPPTPTRRVLPGSGGTSADRPAQEIVPWPLISTAPSGTGGPPVPSIR
jgi:hypothetical protein